MHRAKGTRGGAGNGATGRQSDAVALTASADGEWTVLDAIDGDALDSFTAARRAAPASGTAAAAVGRAVGGAGDPRGDDDDDDDDDASFNSSSGDDRYSDMESSDDR
jgi:hypothetical protein